MIVDANDPKYRPNVGLMVIKNGLILVGERSDHPGNWQMPQGGIDKDENTTNAAFRELEEETGLTQEDVKFIAKHSHWLAYKFGEHKPRDKYLGQKQKWFVFEYNGETPDPENAIDKEFLQFDWWPAERVVAECVEFRKHVYEQIMRDFKEYLK